MKETQDNISEKFLSCLLSFMHGAGETSLECGYTTGREAIECGFGVLKIAETYVTALHEILAPVSPEAARMVTSTQEFLSTSLAPFEMTHRGYRESMARLQKLNVTLEHQTQELASLNRELEAFSSSVSHDLRAPVRTISGFSKILLEDHGPSLNSDGRELLCRIEQATVLMGSLIEGLLSLSRFGHQALDRESLDLGKLAQEIVSELQNAHPHRDVHVKIDNNLVATGDRRLLRVVLYNLLANAWKFTAKTMGAEIEFGKTSVQGEDIFCLKDNGSGFDMNYADKLFRPFQRLHSKDDFEGTGIGLATVHRIIQRHGGRVWAESAVDRGATFYFTL